MYFNEIFRKNVTCDNIRKHNFKKNTGGGQIDPPTFLGLRPPILTNTCELTGEDKKRTLGRNG